MKAELREGYQEQIDILNKIISKIEAGWFISDLSEKNAKRKHVEARAMYYRLAKQLCVLPLDIISKQINRDHSTLVHSLRKFDMYLKYNPLLTKLYKKLCIEFDIANDIQIETQEDNTALVSEDNEKYNELIALILKVPEKHIETIKTRLTPIVQMLPA